jgi:hypothetical protein
MYVYYDYEVVYQRYVLRSVNVKKVVSSALTILLPGIVKPGVGCRMAILHPSICYLGGSRTVTVALG